MIDGPILLRFMWEEIALMYRVPILTATKRVRSVKCANRSYPLARVLQ